MTSKPLSFATAAWQQAPKPEPTPLMAALQRANHGPVSTFGWDSVFTIRIDAVNAELKRDGAGPAGFEQTIDDGHSAEAQFGDWSIANTGDGKLINFNVPLKNVRAVIGGVEKAMPNALATVQVELEFVPQSSLLSGRMGARLPQLAALAHSLPAANDGDDSSASGDAMELHHLVIKTRAEAPLMGALANDALAGQRDAARLQPLKFDTSGPAPGMMDKTVVEVALSQWLNANLDAFAHIFASVNLAREVGSGAFSWLKPTHASYAFQSGNDQTDPQLAILCMSEQRDASYLYSVVAQGALTEGEDSGTFVISGRRLLDQMIRNALPSAFKGLKKTDAVLNQAGTELVVAKPVHLTQVDHDGKKYDALLNHLSISLDGSQLVVESHSDTEVSPGVHSECSVRSCFTIGLMILPDGNRTLEYKLVNEDTHHSTRHDTGIEILKWILLAVGVIVGVVLGALTGGAAGVLVVALVALVFGVLQYLPDMIAAINKNNAPPIDLLVTNATAPIHWSGGRKFQLTDVCLNESLLLTGVMAR